jgi:hypothetical protein
MIADFLGGGVICAVKRINWNLEILAAFDLHIFIQFSESRTSVFDVFGCYFFRLSGPQS